MGRSYASRRDGKDQRGQDQHRRRVPYADLRERRALADHLLRGRATHYDVLYLPEASDDTDVRKGKGGDKAEGVDTKQSKTSEPAVDIPQGSEGRIHKTPRKAGQRLRGKDTHTVTTINLGGSREALNNALEIDANVLLIQEHRLLGPELQCAQAMATKAGWNGIWDPAQKTPAKGRSGGTAVLVRSPVQIHRGPRLSRMTVAIIPWTRKNHIHVITVYGAHSTHPDRDKENTKMFEDIQQYLAVIGRVPSLIGGDWNIQPQELKNYWSKGGNQVHTKGPTQKHGSNLDWFLAAEEVNLSEAKGCVIVGADHVAVEATLGGAQSKTLGYRMVAPAGFEPSRLNTCPKNRPKEGLSRQPTGRRGPEKRKLG